jgi:hypothetical protein
MARDAIGQRIDPDRRGDEERVLKRLSCSIVALANEGEQQRQEQRIAR